MRNASPPWIARPPRGLAIGQPLANARAMLADGCGRKQPMM
jgi:hypothetical protein